MRIGVDAGGTFTDVVALDATGALRTAKLRSTPGEPDRAVLAAIAAAGGRVGDAATSVTHGTTVATNALLERRGGPTALVTTEGFEDLLALRRHARPLLYALHPTLDAPLVPEELRLPLRERRAHDGSVVLPIDEGSLRGIVERLAAAVAAGDVRSIAVSLIHAYAADAHERCVGERLAGLGVPVSLSSEVMPEHREYERTSTTVVDAYVAPVVAGYLARLAAVLPSLRVMLSSGGAASAQRAARHAVTTILSGPAAGVVAGRRVARAAGIDRFITFDVGGTSTDIALVDGDDATAGEAAGAEPFTIAGQVVRAPSLPIHTVGAGGGSIAWRDRGGALKVGPRSAGAVPGPACYGAGGLEPTLTDAAVVLDRIPTGRVPAGGRAAAAFLEGALVLDGAAAWRVVGSLAAALGLGVPETAAGIVRVAAVIAARAIRVVSVERGHDPRDFALLAFGGAGGLLACEVADELDVDRVLVPPEPGLLCAYGALVADVVTEHAATRIVRLEPGSGPAAVSAELSVLERQAEAVLDGEGIPRARRRLIRSCDARYAGQSYELAVVLPDGAAGGSGDFDLVEAFHALHERRHGYADRARAVERVALRVRGLGAPEDVPSLQVRFEEGPADLGHAGATAVLARARLRPGVTVSGPAAIVEASATIWVAPGWSARVEPSGALLLEPRERRANRR